MYITTNNFYLWKLNKYNVTNHSQVNCFKQVYIQVFLYPYLEKISTTIEAATLANEDAFNSIYMKLI